MPVVPDLIYEAPNTEEARCILREITRLKATYCREQLTIQTPGCFGLFAFRRSLAPSRFAYIDISEAFDCPAGIRNYVIGVDNYVYPCVYLMTNEMQIGTFTEKRINIRYPQRIPGKFRTEESAAYIYWKKRDLSESTL